MELLEFGLVDKLDIEPGNSCCIIYELRDIIFV